MADNIAITAGSGTTVATDDIGGVQHQRVKLSLGADGTANDAVAGAGVVGTGVQRMTLASDDPAVAALVAIRDATSTVAVSGPLTDTQLRATPVGVTSGGYDVSTTFTASTTAIDAGDVLGATAAALTFTTVGPSAGSIMITGVQYLIPLNAIPTNMTSFRLHLYNVTPPSALASGAAWDLATVDQASYLGFIDLGSPVDMGTTLYCEANGINKQVRLSSANIFGYLVSNGGSWTPTAIIHKITLHTVAM
jgi:hypothetical protein